MTARKLSKSAIAVASTVTLILAMFIGSGIPAQAATDINVYTHVVDETGANLAGETITACFQGSTSQVCATGTTGNDGKAVVPISLNSPNSSVYVYAGSASSSKWINFEWTSVSNGVISGGSKGTLAQPIEFVQKPRYALSGTVRQDSSSGALVSSFPLSYSYTLGSQTTCVDVLTNGSGAYTISSAPTPSVSLSLKSCNDYSNSSLYDTISPFGLGTSVASTYSATNTKDIVLTQTGIKVHVTDGSTPLAGVGIRIVEASCTSTTYCNSRQSTTDSNGDAVFASLTPGSEWKAAYPMYVSSPCTGCTPQIDPFQATINSTSKTVSTGLASDALVLSRTAGYPETPATISGKIVTGPSNVPVAGARVSMSWSARLGSSNISGNASTVTDASGNYSFSNLPYGPIYISVTAANYRNASTSKITSQSGGNSYTNVNLNLRDAPVGNLTVRGTLKTTGNPGTAIASRRIYLYQMGGSSSTPVDTNSNGEFSFTGLAEGNYYLSVDTYSDSLYENLQWSSSNVLLTQATSANVLDLRLTPRSNAGTVSATGFIGEYLESAGSQSATGLAGKSVYLYPQSGGQGVTATTGSDGSWSATGLIAGQKYWVSVSGVNYQDYEYPMNSNSFIAPLTGSASHQLLLKKLSAGTGSLAGRVKNATTYANIQGITVSLYRSAGGVNVAPVTTNAQGEYSFTSLPAGEYYLSLYDASGQSLGVYAAATGGTPTGAKYKSASMSVEIAAGANRVNALLAPVNAFPGSLSGEIKDERGVLMANASVQVWDPLDPTVGAYTSTNSSGQYSIKGIPLGRSMRFKVQPPYDLSFEVTSFSDFFALNEYVQSDTKNVQLFKAALISGMVNGIPSTGNVPMVWVQLIDPSSGTIVASDYVNSTTGVYTIKSVAQGSYLLRFTQMGKTDGYSGGGGFGASGGDAGELVSLKPVYWDGSPTGTTSRTSALPISVGLGDRIMDKSMTMTKGSILTGDLTIDTPSGISKLTGTRWVQVYVYQKQANGDYLQVGYPAAVSGYSNSKLEVAGLAAGIYKLKFEDYRKGANSLATSWNGGAANLLAAPEITVGNEATVVVNQTMKMALPEKSADAFNLDELEAARLAELENQISTSGSLVPGGQTRLYVGTEFAGEYVSAFANSTPVALGSWKQVDKDGYISVVVPMNLVGSHRIAVQDANAQVIGWTAVQVGSSGSATQTNWWADDESVAAKPVSLVAAQPVPLTKTTVPVSQSNTDNSGWQWWLLGGLFLVLAVIAAAWALIARRK